MTKDYASRISPKKRYSNIGSKIKANPKNPVAGWVWLVTGLLIGLFIAGLVIIKVQNQPSSFVNSSNKSTQEHNKAYTATATTTPNKTKDKEPATKERKFDFYTLLPNMEVDVPDIATPTTNKIKKLRRQILRSLISYRLALLGTTMKLTN
jgi:hypothetical protein